MSDGPTFQDCRRLAFKLGGKGKLLTVLENYVRFRPNIFCHAGRGFMMFLAFLDLDEVAHVHSISLRNENMVKLNIKTKPQMLLMPFDYWRQGPQ